MVIKIGVLELQGGFALHHKILSGMDIKSVPVKNINHLENIDGLIIPGGESSTISLLIKSNEMFKPLVEFSKKNPVMGTCAGLILMSKFCNDQGVRTLGLLDITVSRNAYGRQVYSKTEHVNYTFGNKKTKKIPTTLIRAPKIEQINKDIIILGEIAGSPVAILSGHFLGLTFHPELDGISLFHELLFDHNSDIFYKKINRKYAA